jgi:starvation-inducible DNA-binding protein
MMKMNRTQRRHPDVAVSRTDGAKPVFSRPGHETQLFGTIVTLPIALDAKVCADTVQRLNQILADSMALRDLYKKHHWQIAGTTFYPLHLLFDKHAAEQSELIDEIAERIQLLGGISLAMAADVAETTRVPRPPRGRETAAVQLSRLAEAHELVIREVREAARHAAEAGDDGTNDLLISNVLRGNEMQVWFISEHLVAGQLVNGESAAQGSHPASSGR